MLCYVMNDCNMISITQCDFCQENYKLGTKTFQNGKILKVLTKLKKKG